jgi:dCMP deaminase
VNVSERKRPQRAAYYMTIAMAVRARAECHGNRVGALLVLDDRIISTGYNGTPANMINCTEGGCPRCAQRDRYASGRAYDICICVHAEQNALLTAARFGIATEGTTLYSTMRPCFGCTKELLQAHVSEIRYLHDWQYPEAEMQQTYQYLQAQFEDGVHSVDLVDDDEVWAVSRKRQPSS